MTDPEHYQQADRILSEASTGQGDDYMRHRAELLAMAQVHATLACAAASAIGAPPTEAHGWHDVAGTRLSKD